jgi:hypothetical protein
MGVLMSDRTGTLDGDRLFYQVWEAPDARADVVLSHGYAEHSGRYGHVAEQLVAAGLSVWARPAATSARGSWPWPTSTCWSTW